MSSPGGLGVEDNTAILWDAGDRCFIRTFNGHTDSGLSPWR